MNIKDRIRALWKKLDEDEKFYELHKNDWQCEICSHLNSQKLGCCEICHNVKDVR